MHKKKVILIAGLAVVVAILAIVLAILFLNKPAGSEEVTYEKSQVTTVTMKQTITAAGQVTPGETVSIKLAKNKKFKASNVENQEMVKKGQPIIFYKDGTHTDATVDGIVKSVPDLKSGDQTSEDSKVQISNLDKLYLKILIPEDTINNLAKGNTATIVVNSEPDKEFYGTIIGIKAMSTDLMKDAKGQVEKSEEDDEDVDSEEEYSHNTESEEVFEDDDSEDTGSENGLSYYAVNIEFENDGKLKPGMSANTTITISDRSNVLAVPVEAVKFDDDGNPYVLVGDKSNPKKKPIEFGESDPINVEILSGLTKGEEILIERVK